MRFLGSIKNNNYVNNPNEIFANNSNIIMKLVEKHWEVLYIKDDFISLAIY